MSEEKNLVLENQNNDEMQVLSIRVSRLLADEFKYMASLENRSQGEFFEGLMQLKKNEHKPNLSEIKLKVINLLPEINSNSSKEVLDSKIIIFNGEKIDSMYKEPFNIMSNSTIDIFEKRCPELLNYNRPDYEQKYIFQIYKKYNSIGEVEDFIIYEEVKVESKQAKEIIAIWSDYLLTSKDDLSMMLIWNFSNLFRAPQKKEVLEAVAKIERL